MLKKEIGQRLRELRQSRKDSLRTLAEKININFTTLQKIETGDNYPSIDMLDKIANHYGIHHSYFFGDPIDVPEKFKGKIDWGAFGGKMEQYNLDPEKLEKMLEGFLEHLGDKGN